MADAVCPLMHESTADTGWDVLPVTLNGARVHTHVVPCGDTRRHQLDPSCWCERLQDDADPLVWAHNSADGREQFEIGDRQPS